MNASAAPQPSFFSQLLGHKANREVSLSKAFAACFRESAAFRHAILDLLWATCRVRGRQRRQEWTCHTEVVIDPQSRPDIHILPTEKSDGPLFRLESKVSAPLRSEQLTRYRLKMDGQYLVVITKRPPEVGRAWIERHGVFALRWQDIHRTVDAISAKGRDHYICDSFATYLEELGMAHREDLRAADLEKVGKLFGKVAAPKTDELNATEAFRIADDCLGVLDDVMAAAVESQPKLVKWSRWGPKYYKWLSSSRVPYHMLVFRFHDAKWRTWFGAEFVFVETPGPPAWQVSGATRKTPERYYERALSSICRKDGTLDPEKMLRSFLSGAKADTRDQVR